MIQPVFEISVEEGGGGLPPPPPAMSMADRLLGMKHNKQHHRWAKTFSMTLAAMSVLPAPVVQQTIALREPTFSASSCWYARSTCGAVGFAAFLHHQHALGQRILSKRDGLGAKPKAKRTTWHDNFKSSRMFDAKTDPVADGTVSTAGAGDWEVVKDDATGNPYWWNVKTNKTTWEQPPGAPALV